MLEFTGLVFCALENLPHCDQQSYDDRVYRVLFSKFDASDGSLSALS
jgi:hypothetical protein